MHGSPFTIILPRVPWSNPDSQPAVRSKEGPSPCLPTSWLKSAHLFFHFSFQKHTGIIPVLVLPHENEQQAKHFSSYEINLTYFHSISHIGRRGKSDTQDMGLHKRIAYFLTASVSEDLRDKWHVYNYPSTISKLEITSCSLR